MNDLEDFEVEVVEDGQRMETPEMVSILNEEQVEAVVEYVKKEYEQAKNDMEMRNQKLVIWRRNMEAVASDAPKHSPFKNSSNVVVPVTQVLTQNLYAKVKGTFDARDPLWSTGSVHKDEHEQQIAAVVEKYLSMLAESPYDLDMEQVMQDLFFESILVGGSFPQVVYAIESWRVKDGGGGEREVVWHDGPQVIVRPLEKVKYRRGVPSIGRLPWVGVDISLTEMELRERASKGIYDPEAVQKVLTMARTSPTAPEAQQQQAESYSTGETTDLFDLVEVYLYWDVDGTGVPVDLLLTMHLDAGVILKQQYNTLGVRNLVASKYVHRPFAMTGRGTGQMTESMQTEVTVTHNLRNDNAKTAGMRLLAVKKSAGFGTRRELFPGAIWEMEDPERDLKAIQLGEVYPSSLQAENQGWSIAQRAVGLSDVQMGFADSTLASRDTARGQAMRLQQGDSILGSVVEGLKSTLSQIGMLVWMQCVMNKERVIARERTAGRLGEEDLALLEEALSMDVSEVPMRIRFSVKTTEADKTYEQQRMNVMTLSQIYAQFASQTVPLASTLYGPEGQQMLQQTPEAWQYMARVLVGAGKLASKIFDFFGVHDTNNYIPDPEKLDVQLDQFQGAFVPPGMGTPGGMPMQGTGQGIMQGGNGGIQGV